MDEQSIFLRAIEKEPGNDRKAFLDEVCDGDRDLRAGVESLLAAYESPDSFLASPWAECVDLDETSLGPQEVPGSVIGPYKIREQIGEGGMGLVYVAEQTQPVRRKVALKVIKPGMDSRQVVARFEAERQALAMMDHPNIARVFDGGATETGRPYFVMEFVKGAPITEYCNEHRLPLRERLRLFLAVCSAVQHAHQKGIIHRDIKPSNVMVASHDGVPVVKVIDFGVAKAIHQPLTDKTIYTHVAQFLGTPMYMSPEQAGHSSLDVDTRTDIYALGVLLYELLTGATPFDKERMRTASYDEIRRVIQEEEPPKPSERVSTLAQADSTVMAQNKAEVKALSQDLRGELDWIVMKALEKERNRRYESASALAADVERYLNDEPVQACPPSRAYVMGKFLRRHRVGVAATVASIAASLVFAAGAAWVVIDRANRHAEFNHQKAITENAVEEDLKEAERQMQREEWANARQALERAKGRLSSDGSSLLHEKIEQRQRDLDLIAKIEEARTAALSVQPDFNRNATFIASDRSYTAVFAEFGIDLKNISVHEAAHKIRTSAIRMQLVGALDHWTLVKGRLPSANGELLRSIAQLADDNEWRKNLRDQTVASDRNALEQLAADQEVLNQPPANLVVLSSLLEAQQSKAAAIHLLRRARQRYPADYRINFDLGNLLAWDVKTAFEAVGFLRAAIALQPKSPHAYILLAHAWSVGKLHLKEVPPLDPEAAAACHKAIQLKPDFAQAYFFHGNGQLYQDHPAEAVKMFRKVVEIAPENRRGQIHLIFALLMQGEISQEEAFARDQQVRINLVNTSDSRHYDLLTFMQRSTIGFEDHGRLDLAENIWEMVVKQLRRQSDPAASLEHALSNLGLVLLKQQKLDKAEMTLRETLELHTEKSPDDWNRFHVMSLLGEALLGQKKYAEAEPLLLEGYEGLKKRETQIPEPTRRHIVAVAAERINTYNKTTHRSTTPTPK